jgi:hypothetical protein
MVRNPILCPFILSEITQEDRAKILNFIVRVNKPHLHNANNIASEHVVTTPGKIYALKRTDMNSKGI